MEEPLAGVGAVASMEMEESSSVDGDAETSSAGVAHSHCSGDDCAGPSGSEFFKEKLSPSRVAEYHNRGVRRASARQAERAVKGSVDGGRRTSVRQAEHRAKDHVMSCKEATSVSLGVCFQFRDSGSCSRSP